MLLVDHLLIVLLFLVQPLFGIYESRRNNARWRAGLPLDRVEFYRHTMIMEWAFLGVLAGVWMLARRPADALGFVAPGGTGFYVGLAVLAALLAYLLFAWHWTRRAGASDKSGQLEKVGKVIRYLPHTRKELRHFYAVSATAGIVEEIVYRGFVFWYLAQFMPLWAVVVVSSLAFGFGHSYQGPAGAVRCGIVGMLFGLFYIVTGSIWLPIVAHFLLDALQGAAIYELTRAKRQASEAG